MHPGPICVGLIVGSEGTLAVVTRIVVRILRKPESVRTLLAAFESIGAAGTAVSEIIAAGIIPAAVEMMDALAIQAAEAAVHPGFPAADAVLIVELDGPNAELQELFPLVEQICRRTGADKRRDRDRRRAACAHLEGPESRIRRDGTGVAELLRAGRRCPAYEASRGAHTDSSAGDSLRPSHRAMSSMPAMATCIR